MVREPTMRRSTALYRHDCLLIPGKNENNELKDFSPDREKAIGDFADLGSAEDCNVAARLCLQQTLTRYFKPPSAWLAIKIWSRGLDIPKPISPADRETGRPIIL